MAGRALSRRELQKAEIRAELIEAAHDLVRQEGYEGLTIRKLAARVGYAPMSVYSYFPDKHAILFALAQDAFAMLARRMERDPPAGPLEALVKLMREYAAFGFDNPNEYRTVFMTRDPADFPDSEMKGVQKDNPALQLLLKRVQACVDAGVLAGDVFAIATLIWTFGHGMVSLLISFPNYPFGDRDAFVERTIELCLAGIRSAPVAPLANSEGC
ncbi:TetR/AcrR family transcriptional regulator [Mesorhizobium sp. LHD-90]|uniref:TetR/AcrR family transcriptional regulator n=1 Tax=Mesorhizobium sp. LHD-90 TaxID=3071414 RepID=UPI0027E15E2A|nr:TetR/AcrR family transcriptional regulator [Mesorhizobium sp. LHD-90]MDQ6437773.1 TetR/AcrR family transcriptional regulator [Mesorhizobium sp. LHD-90]